MPFDLVKQLAVFPIGQHAKFAIREVLLGNTRCFFLNRLYFEFDFACIGFFELADRGYNLFAEWSGFGDCVVNQLGQVVFLLRCDLSLTGL